MMRSGLVRLAAFAALLLAAATANAQGTPDDVAVWSVIEAQWQADERNDLKWIESLLAEDFVGWSRDSPAPRNKASVRMWQKFESKQWDGMMHELYPLSIVIHGDTAIAHYLYTNAGKNEAGETEVTSGRFTDVLVKVGDQWKFLSWHGGAD